MGLEKNTVFVVGAGFSSYSGLPLQRDFTQAILEGQNFKQGSRSKSIVQYVRKFVQSAFGQASDSVAGQWPNLEDVFTFIDLAANTGHCLGSEYPPAELRTLRRALIARIIRMLRQKYMTARKHSGTQWMQLDSFLREIDFKSSAFISMNWDTSLEEKIRDINRDAEVDYACDALPTHFEKGGRRLIEVGRQSQVVVPVVKIHGSTNWLYCDNCRQTFSVLPWRAFKVADQILTKEDWQRIDPKMKVSHHYLKCTRCAKVSLGARLATFSFQKALAFPMFEKSWFSAEKLLQNGDVWVFVGYSLPAADFAFKYLLKRVQLARSRPPQIIVVTGGESQDIEKTRASYQRFFGGVNFFEDGLTKQASRYISKGNKK